MTYDLRQIMRRAWDLVKANPNWRKMGLRFWMRRALAQAWREAKEAVRKAAMTVVDRLREARSMLENTDRWTDADHAEAKRLDGLIRAETENEHQRKRDLIASAAGRFASVTFIKKDGSVRVMRVQPASLRQYVKWSDASEPARRAAQTRAERHPNLLPVWDAENAAPRSVNLSTVTRIAVNGATHEFRAH